MMYMYRTASHRDFYQAQNGGSDYFGKGNLLKFLWLQPFCFYGHIQLRKIQDSRGILIGQIKVEANIKFLVYFPLNGQQVSYLILNLGSVFALLQRYKISITNTVMKKETVRMQSYKLSYYTTLTYFLLHLILVCSMFLLFGDIII
ncbi:hypothetical protein ACJX0J_037120 [Zea mays]